MPLPSNPRRPMRRPLIVTDKGVIAAGLWAKVKEQLPGNMPITIYDETPENPTEAAMRDALKIYKEVGYDGMIMPDHVPHIDGGAPDETAFAFCFGYIIALFQANGWDPYGA